MLVASDFIISLQTFSRPPLVILPVSLRLTLKYPILVTSLSSTWYSAAKEVFLDVAQVVKGNGSGCHQLWVSPAIILEERKPAASNGRTGLRSRNSS